MHEVKSRIRVLLWGKLIMWILWFVQALKIEIMMNVHVYGWLLLASYTSPSIPTSQDIRFLDQRLQYKCASIPPSRNTSKFRGMPVDPHAYIHGVANPAMIVHTRLLGVACVNGVAISSQSTDKMHYIRALSTITIWWLRLVSCIWQYTQAWNHVPQKHTIVFRQHTCGLCRLLAKVWQLLSVDVYYTVVINLVTWCTPAQAKCCYTL